MRERAVGLDRHGDAAEAERDRGGAGEGVECAKSAAWVQKGLERRADPS